MKLAKVTKKEKINPKEIQRQYANKFEEELSNMGVIFFDEKNLDLNTEYIVLPKEITEVSPKDLGEFLNAFTQQKLYLRTLLGRAEVDLDATESDYLTATQALYKRFSNDKLSEKAKDRIINGMPEVKPVFDCYVEAQRKCKLISQAIDNTIDAIFLISREISRRVADFGDEMRDYNIQRK